MLETYYVYQELLTYLGRNDTSQNRTRWGEEEVGNRKASMTSKAEDKEEKYDKDMIQG